MNEKFIDERGVIEILEKNKTVDILKITSKINTRRAGHYHKTSGHWIFVTKGDLLYFERPFGKADDFESKSVRTFS